ncbi:MAG: radical SAM family heme chaperone HemW [Rikenellaceae bacterium]
MASIYLHIPFCRRICGYCDFFKSARLDKLNRVVGAMMSELESERGRLSTPKISTIYFGGGTPSLLSVEQVGAFIIRIGELYDVSKVDEITLEANPDDLTQEYLEGLRSVGVNRLSIGIQSFDDEELKFMNRRHNAEQAEQAVKWAREVGFENIAIDLIFGVSGFGEEVLTRSLDRAIKLDVEHIAAYHLTIEEGTAFGRKAKRGEMSPVDEELSEREYDIVRRRLTEAGFEHYEISNFAREGRRSRHNSAYWRGEEYLGIGAGAHSFFQNERRWGRESIDEYLEDERYEGETLTPEQRRNEVIMTSLRCAEGLDLTNFELLFGKSECEKVINDAKLSLKLGDLKLVENRLVIPHERFLRSDTIIELLFN